MLQKYLREQLKLHMKNREQQKTNICRMVISEFERQPVCKTLISAEQQEFRVVRKLIEGNTETLKYMPTNDDRYAALVLENEFLSALLPKTLSAAEIKTMLLSAPNLEQIKTANSDGKAIGEAMKFLKSQSAEVQGSDVQEVVKEIRGI